MRELVNYPAGMCCENDVVSTSMRRHHVASTLIRRHFGTKCPLGNGFDISLLIFTFKNIRLVSLGIKRLKF